LPSSLGERGGFANDAILSYDRDEEVDMRGQLRRVRWVFMIVVTAWVLAGCPAGDGGSGGY
jgi:hypothetical protein